MRGSKRTYTATELKDSARRIAKIHILASGPVTFESVADYVYTQAAGIETKFQARNLAALALVNLIQSGEVRQYDDFPLWH